MELGFTHFQELGLVYLFNHWEWDFYVFHHWGWNLFKRHWEWETFFKDLRLGFHDISVCYFDYNGNVQNGHRFVTLTLTTMSKMGLGLLL